MQMYKGYAKINLGLKVINRDEVDGYHYIDMVTIPLEFHDRLEIEVMPDYCDTIMTCDDHSIPVDESNTVYKALKAMQEHFSIKKKLRIHIHKEVPVCAGLGGGSADAAALMIGLNKMFKLKASEDELCEVGIKVGSDVPLCIKNKPCHVEGKGKEINTFKLKKQYYVLLAKPKQGLSTKEVYNKYDELHEESKGDINLLIKGLEKDDYDLIKDNMNNDLEKPAKELNSSIDKIVNVMKDNGLELSMMTGSGSCVYCLSKDYKKLEMVSQILKKQGHFVVLTKTLK